MTDTSTVTVELAGVAEAVSARVTVNVAVATPPDTVSVAVTVYEPGATAGMGADMRKVPLVSAATVVRSSLPHLMSTEA